MSYKKIFVDSDILLDLLLQREPFALYSRAVLNRVINKKFEAYTSALVIANVHYMVTKNNTRSIAKEKVEALVKIIGVLPLESDVIDLALASEHVDFEDTIQFYIAEKFQCDLILTRNIKHFSKFDLPVLTAEQFLRTL